MSLTQLLMVLRARWWVVLLGFVLVAGAAGLAIQLLPRQYTATAQVIVDLKQPELAAGIGMPAHLVPGAMATQIDIITSEKVALTVVDRLKLAENPVAVEQFREEGAKGSIRLYLAKLLLKALQVKPARESAVLAISFTGKDPRFAAIVANEFARAYIDTSIELRVEPARQAALWFDEQTRTLRDNLEASQRKLSDFQRSKGIVMADERIDVETAKLQELSSQVTVLSSQTVDSAKREAQAREVLARGGASELPEVLANALVQQLKADQVRLEAKLREQSAILGANHPEILKLKQEIASIAEKEKREIATVANSLAQTYTVNRQREAEIRAALERQRAKVLQIKQVRDELQVLQRDVDNAQRVFDTVTQRLSQKTLESQATQAANILLLNAATEPTDPSSPNVGKIAVGGLLGGLLLGGAAALALEMLRRRVRSAEDLAAAVQAPVIGNIRRVPRATRRAQGWAMKGA